MTPTKSTASNESEKLRAPAERWRAPHGLASTSLLVLVALASEARGEVADAGKGSAAVPPKDSGKPAVGAPLSSSLNVATELQAARPRDSAPKLEPAGPPPTAGECSAALSKGQLLGASEQLVEAREQVRICANHACPQEIASECVRSASELDQAIPSVTFEVRFAGLHAPEAQVFADGRPVLDWTRGKALQLNPGEHVFHFDLVGHPSITKSLKLDEGARFKTVDADFLATEASSPVREVSAPMAAPRIVTVHYERPVPVIVYPLFGVGALGLLSFTTLGVVGRLEQRNLEKSCAPRCTDEDKSSMRRVYFAADVSLGIGAAALAGAAVLYLGRPERPAKAPTVGVVPMPGGALATIMLDHY